MPPGTMSTLYKGDDRFIKSYFDTYPGYYDTCDAGIKDSEGYISVMAREDDVINVAGHRLSTSALEEVILKHPDIAQAIVVGIPDDLKGQSPFALYVPIPGKEDQAEEISKKLVQMVRQNVGAVAAFKLSVAVSDLPRTRSGKTPRKTIADLVSGKKFKVIGLI
jgi:propionyl-CoA synthetase